MRFPSGKTGIVGTYLTEQTRKATKAPEEYAFEAVKGALDDAGLTFDDVDGIVSAAGVQGASLWSRLFGRPVTLVGTGSPGAVSVAEAAAYLDAGLCDVVVTVQARAGMRTGPVQADLRDSKPYDFLGLAVAGFYAQMATRHMYEFGTTPEQLAEVAVAFRHHATLNPRSVMGPKGPITVDDVLTSRMVSSPLHLLDCCIDNDGGYAFVMTTMERAKDLRKPPVAVLGGQSALWSGGYDEVTPNFYPSPAAHTGQRAMAQAGVTHDDLDVLGIYDCFTITVLRLLEDLGFCKVGEGGPFVEGGTLGLGGKFPTNTDGGLLSHSHVGYPAGSHVIEVARQLWQEVEPERQVPSPRLGLCHHQGQAVLGRHGTCVLGLA